MRRAFSTNRTIFVCAQLFQSPTQIVALALDICSFLMSMPLFSRQHQCQTPRCLLTHFTAQANSKRRESMPLLIKLEHLDLIDSNLPLSVVLLPMSTLDPQSTSVFFRCLQGTQKESFAIFCFSIIC